MKDNANSIEIWFKLVQDPRATTAKFGDNEVLSLERVQVKFLGTPKCKMITARAFSNVTRRGSILPLRMNSVIRTTACSRNARIPRTDTNKSHKVRKTCAGMRRNAKESKQDKQKLHAR
jgi:hypothetical protein